MMKTTMIVAVALAMASTTMACGGSTIAPATPASKGEHAREDTLEVVASSDEMIWNAVAVEGGRVFVAGPRWTGSRGPAVGVLDSSGHVAPFPDAAWNGWAPGADPSRSFVSVNAIHLDEAGGLWVVDTGAPDFGGDPVPGGAKLVRIALASGSVDRVLPLGDVVKKGSYIDDIRFGKKSAYLTDAGAPGLVVLDLATGKARRVLDGHSSVKARADRDVRVAGGAVVRSPSGEPLRVHADPLELSADGAWLHYGPLAGPWSRVPTSALDDMSLSADDLARKVEPWADLPAVGGTAMGPEGELYFTDLEQNAVKKRAADGTITTLVTDPRLHWVDAPFLDRDGALWLPVPQMHRVGLFNGGQSKINGPVRLFRLRPKRAVARVVDIGAAHRESMASGLERRYVVGEKTTLAIFDFAKGARVPEHSHPNEQVSYIPRGHVRVVAGGETFDVRSGQVIVIPPGIPHSFEALEDTVDIDFFTPVRTDWLKGKATYFAPSSK
ncbi:L-dopachrome tautomerase-related protein [Polyangium aurulentum]|uniref:L-dopachrome tautomerase-related protein n=1 Tax=Polyangium aurulentum TaxID=2567896 RepID=UPI0010ADDFF2|nr:L-dopachrome tautomerase-related protein [Polyangium aurulentum]